MNKNIRNRILFNNDNKLKMYQEGKKLAVTRAAIAVNPLTCYNVSTGNVMEQFANNVLTKHGDYGFVGGDTLEVAFDMGTKVAGSVVECPMKFYYNTTSTALMNPTDPSFVEYPTQPAYDQVKIQDSITANGSSSVTNRIFQFMLELDLTPLCNQLFSGSNAALKAALKSIQADVWAMGSGSNASVLTNGVIVKPWVDSFTTWSTTNTASNSTGSVSKMSVITTSPDTSGRVTSSNKLYFLIHATYPSDGTIPSSVSLDYPKITIQLNRTVDVVAPKTVYLPKYWALVGKISPNFDSADTKERRVIELYRTNNERVLLNYITGSLKAYYIVSGDTSKNTTIAITFSKYQTIGFILTKIQGKFKLFLLKNNDTLKSGEVLVSSETYGSYPFRTLMSQDGGGTLQGDSFTDINALYDLQSLGKANGLTDAEAEVILRGIQYPSTSEMVVNGDFANGGTGWTLHANAIVSGGILTLNANGAEQRSYQVISVLPNSTYTIKVTKTGGTQSYLSVDLLNGATYVSYVAVGYNVGDGTHEITFTTPSSVNNVKIYCTNTGVGTFTFDNISLKYVKPPGQLITAPNKELFDINAVSLHANATMSNGVITLNATAGFQGSDLVIPVLPNNKYQLNFTKTGGGNGYIEYKPRYNNLDLSLSVYYSQGTASGNFNFEFTTPNNCNRVFLRVSSATSGTFYFSNISLKLKM